MATLLSMSGEVEQLPKPADSGFRDYSVQTKVRAAEACGARRRGAGRGVVMATK
jgi:hypothetical protein